MPPSIVFVVILALTVGFLFHSIFGSWLWQLPMFLVSAILGAFAGQILAVLAGIEVVRIGNVPFLMTTAGALVFLGICWFFTAPIQQGSSRVRRRGRRAVSRRGRASA